nr:rho family-interacting cell polarization regulator 2-like [Pocillopora verrucosa]
MGKENSASSKSTPNRNSRSLRMDRHPFESAAARSQSFSASAISCVKPLTPLQSPAELERKHSQIRRKSSGIFGPKPALKCPRIAQTTSVFSKLQSALSEYARHLKDALNSVEPKRKRIVEQRIKLIESRIQQIDEIFQLYLYEEKMREGSRNLLHALTSRGSKGGQDKCRGSINACTEKMCAIEEELETKLGVFRFQLNALQAFGRLCSGDVYDIHIRHGSNFKWKSRCKVERESQKWIDNEFTLRPSITDEFSVRVIEMKKIQANVQIGNIHLRSRNYIKARPQIMSVPLNSTGSMKLKMTVEWRPFSGKEENTLRSKRQSLLSEVIFIQPSECTIPSSDLPRSPTKQKSLTEVEYSVERNEDKPLSVDEEVVVEEVTDSSELVAAGLPEDDLNGIAPEEPQEFRHATSLDSALQHLIPTLQTNKDQFPELDDVITLLEKLEELVKKCSLLRSSMSLSVESALESFDFLEQDAVDETESTPRSTGSGGSGYQDTGYNSTDDYNKDFVGEGSSDAGYIVDFMMSEKIAGNYGDTNDDNGVNGIEDSGLQSEHLDAEENSDRNSFNDSPSCISEIFSSSSSALEKSECLDKAELGCVPPNTSSPRKRIEVATELNEESPQHSSLKTRSSRATSPNLSSSYGHEATVGSKLLDKVVLCHLQFCEEVSVHLGSFGPMKYKEMQALSKFRQQKEVLNRLITFILSPDPVSEMTLPAINPRLATNPALSSLWEKTCKGSLLFTTAGQLVSGFEDTYKKQITQSYNRVVEIVFPVIVARVIHQDPDLTDVQPEEEELVSVFQFEHYFMDLWRPNLSKYIDEVAYELVICKRLRSTEKDAVVAQLKQYTEIPLSKTCFCPVLCLLLDNDSFVAQAAESYLSHLKKNADLRRKAISLSIEALEESEEKLREGACVALTVLQARDAVPQLLYLSRCDVQSVKFAARKALSFLGEEGEDALRQSAMSSSEIAGLIF